MAHQQRALLITEAKGKLTLGKFPKQTVGKGEVLIKNECGAINPVDWKQVEYNFWIPSYPFVLGVDTAGTVEEVGEGVTNVKKGDRVYTYLMVGKDARLGGYQEYSITDGDLLGRLPANVSFAEGCTLGLGSVTAAVGLFHNLKIPFGGPASVDTILIWGGASSVGAYAVQFAKLSGFKNIIATASAKNFDYVKSLGATHVFDYKDPKCIEDIKVASQNNLSLAFDAVGATKDCIAALGQNGGNVATSLGNSVPKELPSNVKAEGCFAGYIYNDPEGHKLGQLMYHSIDAWLRCGHYKPNKVTAIPNGLAGIVDGHHKMKSGDVSATKLVYTIGETPN